MKPALIAIGILLAASLLVSCGDEGAESHPPDVDSHSSHSASDSPDDGIDGLALNNGARWKMDDHTRSVFAKMAGSFLATDHRALEAEDLKKAGAALQVDLNELIQGCTMQGEAHNQLHVYLTGYMPAVAALAEAGRMEDAKTVTHYLEKYDDYFE